jgi:hypothetical protein
MGRIYTVPIAPAAQTAAQDFWAIVSGTNTPTRLAGIHLFQTTELGDAAEEILRVRIRSGQTTVGSGGTAPTPVVNDSRDSAASFTARINDTTQASAGTIVVHAELGWNVRVDRDWWLPPGFSFTFLGARRWTVEFPAAPADSITVGGTLWVEEL